MARFPGKGPFVGRIGVIPIRTGLVIIHHLLNLWKPRKFTAVRIKVYVINVVIKVINHMALSFFTVLFRFIKEIC